MSSRNEQICRFVVAAGLEQRGDDAAHVCLVKTDDRYQARPCLLVALS